VDDCDGLENRSRRKLTGGSNPSPSAHWPSIGGLNFNNCDLDKTECEGRCQSGRLGPPAKRLTVLKPFKGSNPFLPAITLSGEKDLPDLVS
jgi:hypothetical protein